MGIRVHMVLIEGQQDLDNLIKILYNIVGLNKIEETAIDQLGICFIKHDGRIFVEIIVHGTSELVNNTFATQYRNLYWKPFEKPSWYHEKLPSKSFDIIPSTFQEIHDSL